MDNERELSEKNRPSYLKWVWSDKRHRLKLFLTLIGIASIVGMTITVHDPYNEVPFIAGVGAYIATYGFTIGITLQPYLIYRRLRKLNYWGPNSPWKK